jgi:hypothetical protein
LGGFLLSCALLGVAQAGGGPQNVLLVVNANSGDSKTIANHYIRLRNIPASNVVMLNYGRALDSANGRIMREEILAPVIKAIDERKLSAQIDYVVYSADMPWRLNLQQEYPKDVPFPPQARLMASITGATYLYQHTLSTAPSLFDLNTNWFVPGDVQLDAGRCVAQAVPASQAFHGRNAWLGGAKRQKDPRQGQRYLISTMLGVTQGRGNSVAEILDYLKQAAYADAQPPQGKFIYMQNKDVRSQTRDVCFAGAVAELRKLGADAEVQQGIVPTGATNVLGLTTGYADLPLGTAGMKFAPGAIGDNLTSLGGVLDANAGQTSLTEFLRLGAAGASGTVIEPFAIQAKFPLPWVHVHYRRGYSLGEAYYQTVRSPAQLLIVGDPLCQPWAQRPRVTIIGPKPGQSIKGKLSFSLKIEPPELASSKAELYFDGRLANYLPGDQKFDLDTEKLPDGHHELRVVITTKDAVETQGQAVLPVVFTNHGPAPTFKVSPNPVRSGQPVRVEANIAGAAEISIRQNDLQLAKIAGASGTAEFDSALLGSGPVMLQAVGLPAAPETQQATSAVPVSLVVLP